MTAFSLVLFLSLSLSLSLVLYARWLFCRDQACEFALELELFSNANSPSQKKREKKMDGAMTYLEKYVDGE